MRTVGIVALALGVAVVALRAQNPRSLEDIDRQAAQLSVEAAGRGPATPIPLLAGKGRPIAVIYDRFALGVAIARARTVAGESGTVEAVLAHPSFQSRADVVVAYPIDCEGRPNHPTAIRVQSTASFPVAPTIIGEPLRGDAGQKLLPGVAVPDDALVVAFRNLPPIGAAVEIDYDNAVCGGASKTASLGLTHVPSRQLSTAFAGIKLPDQFASLPSPTTVRVSVTLDPTGRTRFPSQVQGPAELGPVAIAAMEGQTFPPATTNGVPVPSNQLVTFVFTTTGQPAPAAPFTPGPAAPGTLTSTQMLQVRMVPSSTTPLPPVPPAPPGLLNSQMTRLAIELGGQVDPTPIPLDAAGAARHGVLFDPFLVTAVKARAASKAGTPLDPSTTSIAQEGLIAVAFPLVCDGKTIAPKDILGFSGGASPGPLAETSPVLSRRDLDTRLPGVTLPDGAIGRAFVNSQFSNGLEFHIRYEETPCGASNSLVSLPIQWVRGVAEPRIGTLKLPEGSTLSSPAVVRVRGMIDTKGAYRFTALADGPAELGVPAAVTAAAWKFQPYRVNGVPVPQGFVANVTFTASGMPEAAPPNTTPNPPSPGNTGPPLVTSSTVNGRPPGLQSTDEPGLTAANSKCAIATDASYGVTAGAPVKVGGDFNSGPARERQYLMALRGPNGQGLSFVRRGATLAPDKTILDLWEVTYTGLAKPIQIYLDEYHEETLKAPQGLVCAVALAAR